MPNSLIPGLNLEAVGAYVLSRRTPEGGYSFYRTPQWGVEEPNAPDTLAALESLRLLGIPPPAPAVTIDWLQSLQEEDGGYPSLTIGWAALRALNRLKAEPTRSPASWLRESSIAFLRQRRPHNWSAAMSDALHVLELLHLTSSTVEGPDRAALNRLLEGARDPLGGWTNQGADLATTGVAVRLSSLGGVPLRNVPAIVAFLRRCEDESLGLRLAPTARATSADALWGGLALSRAFGCNPSYPRAIAQSLALLQGRDGGLGARHRAISNLHQTWIGLQAACLLDELREDNQ